MEIKLKFWSDPKLKQMNQVWQVLRYHYYAYWTEQTNYDWIVWYIKYYGGQTHPAKNEKNVLVFEFWVKNR